MRNWKTRKQIRTSILTLNDSGAFWIQSLVPLKNLSKVRSCKTIISFSVQLIIFPLGIAIAELLDRYETKSAIQRPLISQVDFQNTNLTNVS